MSAEHPRYLAYMLRIWEVGNQDRPAWRVSLESPHTGDRQVFSSLDALLAFLQAETGGPLQPSSIEEAPRRSP